MTDGFEELVNRQIQRWNLVERAQAAHRPGPCVAISRLPHAGGGEIGCRVADFLDYGFFGKELVEEMGRKRGLRDTLLAGLDERVRNAIDRLVADAFRVRAFTESDYLEDLVRAVTTLGERGMVVIVGRGSTYILPPETALRVLIVAPKELRAERLAKARGWELERAKREIDVLDRERAEFVRRQFEVNQLDPLLYDLVLNTGTWTADAAAHLVADAVRARFPQATSRRG